MVRPGQILFPFYWALCSNILSLMEWLQHSQKKYCELCKTPFQFTKRMLIYHPPLPTSANLLPRSLRSEDAQKSTTTTFSLQGIKTCLPNNPPLASVRAGLFRMAWCTSLGSTMDVEVLVLVRRRGLGMVEETAAFDTRTAPGQFYIDAECKPHHHGKGHIGST